MTFVFHLFQRAVGVVHVNPGAELRSDRQLLHQHLSVSLQRCIFVVCGTVCFSPLLYKIANNLTLSQQSSLRQFLNAEEKKTSNQGVRVMYAEKKDTNLEKKCCANGVPSSQPKRRNRRVIRGPADVGVMLYRGCCRLFRLSRACVCHFSAVAGGGGIQNADDLAYRLVSYVFTFVVKRASLRFATRCVVHLSFFVICKAVDGAIGWASTSPKFSAYVQPAIVSSTSEGDASVGGGGLLKGAYQLGDFSQSAPGFMARSCGRMIGGVVTAFKVVISPHINFYWANGEMADKIWSQLTPTGFLLTTALGVLHPLLRLGCAGAFRSLHLLLQQGKWTAALRDGDNMTPTEINAAKRNGGVITVGKVVTRRRFLTSAMRYLVNYHFLGSPIIAYMAATYSWKARYGVWYAHTGGAMYESVSVSLFLWSLISFCLSIPDLPLSLPSA